MKARNVPHARIKELLAIAAKVKTNAPISPDEVHAIVSFEVPDKQTKFQKLLTRIALPGSILLGMSMASFPTFYTNLVTHLPRWTTMTDQQLSAVDYVWSIIGKPVKQKNIIYHVPNIVLYSFGVIGVKKLFEYLRKKTWLDKVNEAKTTLQQLIQEGKVNYNLNDGHSILFIGGGDFIGEQFYLNSAQGDVIVLASKKPNFTTHWLGYEPMSTFQSLQETLDLADAYNCGEYILFPVTDTEIFLPGPHKYDLSPEKVEVMIQSIRDIERIKGWPAKRIIIVGDKMQTSCVQTESISGAVDGTAEFVSLVSVSKRFEKIIILDATDLILEFIMKKYPGRRILFRASVDGGAEYKQRLYARLKEFGYDDNPENDYSLVIGYDLFEEQIERESIATNLQEYLPVVLSREVCDALTRNGYQSDDFIYVPELVLSKLKELAAQS